MSVRNRIVSTAHATVFAQDGRPGPVLNAYQAEKAKGGCGLVICYGSASVHPSSPGKDWGGVEIHDDSIIPYFQKAAEAVHQYGAKIISQISHRGRRGTTDLYWQPLLAPSPIPERSHRETPHQMEIEDILMIVEAYGEAARRVKDGGFDGVEVMMGGGHLPEQFLSPFSNKRTDEYGGSLENRMRFVFQVLDSVRDKVGPDFVVGIRLTGDELIEGVIGKSSVRWRGMARCVKDPMGSPRQIYRLPVFHNAQSLLRHRENGAKYLLPLLTKDLSGAGDEPGRVQKVPSTLFVDYEPSTRQFLGQPSHSTSVVHMDVSGNNGLYLLRVMAQFLYFL